MRDLERPSSSLLQRDASLEQVRLSNYAEPFSGMENRPIGKRVCRGTKSTTKMMGGDRKVLKGGQEGGKKERQGYLPPRTRDEIATFALLRFAKKKGEKKKT